MRLYLTVLLAKYTGIDMMHLHLFGLSQHCFQAGEKDGEYHPLQVLLRSLCCMPNRKTLYIYIMSLHTSARYPTASTRTPRVRHHVRRYRRHFQR